MFNQKRRFLPSERRREECHYPFPYNGGGEKLVRSGGVVVFIRRRKERFAVNRTKGGGGKGPSLASVGAREESLLPPFVYQGEKRTKNRFIIHEKEERIALYESQSLKEEEVFRRGEVKTWFSRTKEGKRKKEESNDSSCSMGRRRITISEGGGRAYIIEASIEGGEDRSIVERDRPESARSREKGGEDRCKVKVARKNTNIKKKEERGPLHPRTTSLEKRGGRGISSRRCPAAEKGKGRLPKGEEGGSRIKKKFPDTPKGGGEICLELKDRG